MVYNSNNSGTVYRIYKILFQVTLKRGLAPHPFKGIITYSCEI